MFAASSNAAGVQFASPRFRNDIGPRYATNAAAVSTARTWPKLPPLRAPRPHLAQSLGAAMFVPFLLALLTVVSSFMKDGEAFVVKLLPVPLVHMLRDSPVTWSLFSAWEFALAAVAAVLTRRHLVGRFLAKDRVICMSYGPDVTQRLNIFLPAQGRHQGPLPVVVFVHGGVWSHSRDWNYRLVGRHFESAGFAAVVLGYGLYPAKCVPDMVEDIHLALAWLRQHGKTLGINPSRTALVGHSSGGHLCALAALGEGERLACVATMNAPFDIVDHYAFEHGRGVAEMSPLHPANGGEENFAALSPTRLILELAADSKPAPALVALPPFYVGHGTADTTVPATQAEKFVAALAEVGVNDADLCLWPEVGHFGALAAMMGMPADANSEGAVQSLQEFLRRHLHA